MAADRKPVPPYLSIGLSTVVYGISERKDIARNMRIIEDAIHGSVSICNINMPVKIVALAEGALTGFTDEVFDLSHKACAFTWFCNMPGFIYEPFPKCKISRWNLAAGRNRLSGCNNQFLPQ